MNYVESWTNTLFPTKSILEEQPDDGIYKHDKSISVHPFFVAQVPVEEVATNTSYENKGYYSEDVEGIRYYFNREITETSTEVIKAYQIYIWIGEMLQDVFRPNHLNPHEVIDILNGMSDIKFTNDDHGLEITWEPSLTSDTAAPGLVDLKLRARLAAATYVGIEVGLLANFLDSMDPTNEA